MQKSISIALAVCVALTGCEVFRKSATWDKVVNTRIHTTGADDPSKEYAEQLHRELAANHVEHKIVTYQYRYRTQLREEAVAQGTAVLYRDDIHPAHPWWLKDEKNGRPVWLPNTNSSRQVAFYLRRAVEIVDTKDFSNSGGKEMIGSEPWKASMQFARVRPHATRALVSVRSGNGREGPSWHARTAAGGKQPAAADRAGNARGASLAWLFKARHGTRFDPASAIDREKMSQLKGVALHSRNKGSGFRTF